MGSKPIEAPGVLSLGDSSTQAGRDHAPRATRPFRCVRYGQRAETGSP